MTEPNAPSRAELLAELDTMKPAPSVEVLRAYVDGFTAPDEYDDQSGAVAHWMNVATSLLSRAAEALREAEWEISNSAEHQRSEIAALQGQLAGLRAATIVPDEGDVGSPERDLRVIASRLNADLDAGALRHSTRWCVARLVEIAASTAALRQDRERLDWLAYDMEGSPLFDALDSRDVHERAGELVDLIVDGEGGEADDLVVQRRAYRQAFREIIDAARQAGQPEGEG